MRRWLTVLCLSALPFAVAPTTPRADETGLTEDYLSDPANIKRGQALFKQQCVRCHGKGAYPGKAPKLKPGRTSPEDIYLRITYGFRKMPAWEEAFTDEERMALTAYVKSSIFSN